MAFQREKISDLYLMDTSVENMFINEYMANAPGDFVKIYLMAQMYAEAGLAVTDEEIARNLGVEHEDVLKAWNYWEQKGILRKLYKEDGDRLHYDVEFLRLREQLYGSQAAQVSPEQSFQSAMADQEIQEMLGAIEQVTGNVMNGTEVTEIVSWLADYHVSPEVILRAYRYSMERKKKNIRYVEAVIRSWAAEGLTDIESLEKKLSENDRRQYTYRRIFRALGFNRNATEEERRIMDSWFDGLGFTLERVLEACKKTTGISSPNINYVNKVLTNWHEEAGDPGAASRRNGVTAGEISRYYGMLREKEEKEAAQRREEVYRKVPRIREIEETLSASAAELAAAIARDRSDRDHVAEELRKRAETMNIEEAFLLTDNGFEVDYMEVKYICGRCHDTGVLETGERCPCYGEVTREKIDLLAKQAR